MIRFSTIIIALTILASCSTRQGQENNDISESDTSHIGYYKLIGDSVEIPSFEIEICLSTTDEHKLKSLHETIIVAAYFTGIPKDTTSNEYLTFGEINVTSCKIELHDSLIAKFEGIKFSKEKYDLLADKDIRLLINAYTGRKSTKSNILDCDILQDKMSSVKDKRFNLKGKLIGDI